MSIRDLGFIAWRDDLAWMESIDGKQFSDAIAGENRRFNRHLKKHNPAAQRIEKELVGFSEVHKGSADDFTYRGWKVTGLGFSPTQVWRKDDLIIYAWDVDISDEGLVAAAAIVPEGWERFTLHILDGNRIIDTIQHSGPQLGWSGDTLYWLKSSADLRYDHLMSWKDGKVETIYSVSDPTKNLEIHRGEDGSVFVIELDFETERLGLLEGLRVSWLGKGANSIIVDKNTWILDGKPNRPIKIPNQDDEEIESLSIKGGWCCTVNHGIRTLWDIGGSAQAPKAMITFWGELSTDSREPNRIEIYDMRYEPYLIRTPEWKLSSPQPYPFPCSAHRHPVPMFVVHPEAGTQAKGLLVTAYGAYGDITHTGSLIPRWAPLLARGWAVAAVCVPGSGDHDLRWRRRGQRTHRKDAIDSLAKGLRDLQEELGIAPSSTVLYGRSAGGLLAISTAVNNPGLVGGVYVESPYVDVLRTISNPKLPLTLLETKEYGIGSEPLDFLATAAWSPLERIPAEGLPWLFVLARQDTNDLEVLPYEVLKFIHRARGSRQTGEAKLLHVSSGRGHFATTLETRAEDLALLENWLKTIKNRSIRYKMANRKNVTMRKRRNSMRKNRRNNTVAMRKNNATMMGGRRRRGRKGTRRH